MSASGPSSESRSVPASLIAAATAAAGERVVRVPPTAAAAGPASPSSPPGRRDLDGHGGPGVIMVTCPRRSRRLGRGTTRRRQGTFKFQRCHPSHDAAVHGRRSRWNLKVRSRWGLAARAKRSGLASGGLARAFASPGGSGSETTLNPSRRPPPRPRRRPLQVGRTRSVTCHGGMLEGAARQTVTVTDSDRLGPESLRLAS